MVIEEKSERACLGRADDPEPVSLVALNSERAHRCPASVLWRPGQVVDVPHFEHSRSPVDEGGNAFDFVSVVHEVDEAVL